jgi:hypothetical protein
MKSMINILLTDNIVEKNEMNHHLIVEMNFAIEQINFKHVALKSALYAKNLIVDQLIIQKRSERIRKSDFRIVISSTKLVKNLIVD